MRINRLHRARRDRDALVRGLGLAIIFEIVDGTSSSIFIAPPILPFLCKKRLRPTLALAASPALDSTGGRRIAGAMSSS
jgi:hypothetical protein